MKLLSEEMKRRLDNDYMYHTPKDGQPERYQRIREAAKNLATVIAEECPSSRELALALTHVESASMFANAAIARNE